MSLIDLVDPNDFSVSGGLSNPAIFWPPVIAGSPANLTIDEFTSSEGVKNLFDPKLPPSFIGKFLVWGEADVAAGTLKLFLAPSTGDRSFPFATLDGVLAVVEGTGGASSGSGSSFRSNKPSPTVGWTLNP
jgi:hypothetical protein